MSRTWPLIEPLSEIEPDDPDREAKELLYKALRKQVWETTKLLTGRLQKLMEVRDGDYVVCRLGGLLGESVYVTSDPDCFLVDVIESRSAEGHLQRHLAGDVLRADLPADPGDGADDRRLVRVQPPGSPGGWARVTSRCCSRARMSR